MKTPALSVIIPVLNEEKCLGSLLTFLQGHPHSHEFEVIVVDGGSVDSSPDIAQSYTNVRFYSSRCASRAHQMNLGASKAFADIFYFVHADVTLAGDFFADIISCTNQGIESGCYRYQFVRPHHPLLYINGFFTRFSFSWCRGGDQTFFIKRDVYEGLGGFDEAFVIMEDYELLDRMRKSKVSFKIIPKNIRVSPRKYTNNSYWKVQLINFRAMRMYRRGIAPKVIKNFYDESLN